VVLVSKRKKNGYKITKKNILKKWKGSGSLVTPSLVSNRKRDGFLKKYSLSRFTTRSLIICFYSRQNIMHLERVWLLWGAKVGGISLRSKVGGSAVWSREIAGKEWVESVAEEDLGTAELWESEAADEGKLEEVVEWEPIGGVEGSLKNAQERENNPVGQPLGVVCLSSRE